jgi:hypothetical protein
MQQIPAIKRPRISGKKFYFVGGSQVKQPDKKLKPAN